MTRCSECGMVHMKKPDLENITPPAAPVAVPAGRQKCQCSCQTCMAGASTELGMHCIDCAFADDDAPEITIKQGQTTGTCNCIGGACTIHQPAPAPLPPTQEPTQPKIGEDAWLELVARTNESLTPEQRQNITAVLEAVDTALNKDRDGVKALAARLLEQQRELAAAESRIAQLERTIEEQTARRMTIRLDEHCVETIEQLTPDGGEEIPFYGIMGGVKLIWVGKSKVEREAALTQAQQERDQLQDSYSTEITIHNKSLDELAELRAQTSALMEAIEPFILPAKTIKSLDAISRDDGKPRLCAKIFDNKITDKQLEQAARVYEQVKEKI